LILKLQGFPQKNGDAIVEIGAVKFNFELGIIGQYSSLVNPQRSIPFAASNVHGIRSNDVADAGIIDIEWQRFTTWADDPDALVAHNAIFEKSFIKAVRPDVASSTIFLDTLKYARLAFPELSNHKLITVCDHIGYRLVDAHRALPDAKATAELLIQIHALKPELFDGFLDFDEVDDLKKSRLSRRSKNKK
jgi:DNA polymerase III epsilon subunit-like protein